MGPNYSGFQSGALIVKDLSTSRSNLGLGTVAVQNAANVAFTGGSAIFTSASGVTGGADEVQWTLRANATQTSAISRVYNSSNTLIYQLSNAGVLSVSNSNAGSPVSIGASNTNGANTASDAVCDLVVNGAAGGNPYVSMTIGGVLQWIAGIDNADSDTYKISRSGGFGTNDFVKISTAGVINYPGQASFLVHQTTSLTGLTKGIDNTVEWDTVIFDQNSDFVSDTFVAPATGRYIFNVNTLQTVNFNTATRFFGKIVTSNRTYALFNYNPTAVDAANNPAFGSSIIADMDAADTAEIVTFSSGGTSTYDVEASTETPYWSGQLLA